MKRWSLITAAAALAALGAPAHAAAASESTPDLTPVVDVQYEFSPDEVEALDVTNTERGQTALREAAAEGVPTDTEPYVVYAVDDQVVTVPAATRVRVVRGVSMEGHVKTDIFPMLEPAAAMPSVGMQSPPKAAWQYNIDGAWTKVIGDNWVRKGIWTITKANNWRACDTCTRHDYYRLYYRVQGGLVDAGAGVGFRRLWVELDRGNNGVSVAHFEEQKPEESHAGVNNVTTTLGFGSTNSINFGYGPAEVTGGTSTSYSGSIASSSENWHPVWRAETGSGGVQWCRYGADFRGTKKVTTRVSYRTGQDVANPPGWALLDGMSESAASCPSAL